MAFGQDFKTLVTTKLDALEGIVMSDVVTDILDSQRRDVIAKQWTALKIRVSSRTKDLIESLVNRIMHTLIRCTLERNQTSMIAQIFKKPYSLAIAQGGTGKQSLQRQKYAFRRKLIEPSPGGTLPWLVDAVRTDVRDQYSGLAFGLLDEFREKVKYELDTFALALED